MKKAKIIWHEWPEEKPPRDGQYLVTEVLRGKYQTHHYLRVMFYCKNRDDITDFGFGESLIGSGYDVIAWAELPEPYKP